MQKEKTANLMKDLGKALLLGLGVGSAVFLPAFLIGLAMNGLAGGLETAKNVLMATGAILLFILAGMILIKGKKNSRFNMEENGWRRHFKVIGPTPVIALFAGSFLAISFIADYIQWMLY